MTAAQPHTSCSSVSCDWKVHCETKTRLKVLELPASADLSSARAAASILSRKVAAGAAATAVTPMSRLRLDACDVDGGVQ